MKKQPAKRSWKNFMVPLRVFRTAFRYGIAYATDLFYLFIEPIALYRLGRREYLRTAGPRSSGGFAAHPFHP